jgi:hypothetical protein
MEEGRSSKIGTFKRILVINKVEKNIKRLFFDIKVKSTINTLQTENFQRYTLLSLYFKNYVIKFRAKKRQEMKKIVIDSIIKRIAK